MKFFNLKLIPLLLLLALFSCDTKKVSSVKTEQISSESYAADWQEVEKMEKKGLAKAIIEKCDAILEKALADNNPNQVFKALAYRSKYVNQVEEESTFKIISDFEQKADISKIPQKQLLHSATAELYYQYFQQNRWRFNQRSQTEQFDPKDLRSWSLDRILKKVHTHYQASLSNAEGLKTYPIEAFSDILHAIDSSRSGSFSALQLQPTLYDFLANRALQYYQLYEGRISIPSKEFNADQHPIFSAAEPFTEIKFGSTDSLSSHFQALRLHQKLIASHLNDKELSTLVHLNLKRLDFAYQISNLENKDSLYLRAINNFATAYEFEQAQLAEIKFAEAELYKNWGQQYNPQDESTEPYRWHLKKAHKIARAFSSGESFGALKCKALLREIERQSFSIQMESTYPVKEDFLFRLAYKNVDSLYFRLYKLPFEINQNRSFNHDEFLILLSEKEAVKSWKTNLSATEDFQNHATELKVKGLEAGNYYMLAAPTSSFSGGDDEIALANFFISDLAYFDRRNAEGNEQEIRIKHRETGTAISNAKVDFYRQEYNYQSRKYKLTFAKSTKANTNGIASVSVSGNHFNYSWMISIDGDTLISNQNIYLYDRNRKEETRNRTHLFTDRAIYRPGQTVYFKGIIISEKGEIKEVKSNFNTTIKLYNTNGEELSKKEVSTNKFGSYHGSFVLPSVGLTGRFRIQDASGSKYFQVEEYKRPTFKVELDSSKKQQRVNDTVEVDGLVQAFSGFGISNAEITYQVKRVPTYPYWPFYRSFFPPQTEKEIAHGIIKSNRDGEFNFNFLAQADPSIKRTWNPVYHFEVNIDATSPSGETQSLQNVIKLSEQALFLKVDIGSALQLEELKDLVFKAENISGKSIRSEATLSLHKLKTPERAKRPKKWPEIDQFQLKNNGYQNSFPTHPRKEESELENYPIDYEVLKEKVICNQKNNWLNELKPGAYELELKTKDRFGNEVNTTKRFTLFDEKSNQPPYPVFWWIQPLKVKAQPGEKASIIIGSSLKNLTLLYEVEAKGKIVESKELKLSNEQRKIEIPIAEVHRGNIFVHFTGIHSNRMIKETQTIRVPFSNKKLAVKLESFRDKMQPGSQEKWTVSVKDHQGKPLESELLASMYDQSLDQFTAEEWNFDLFNDRRSQLNWNSSAFGVTSSRLISRNRQAEAVAPFRVYPQLNWFGLHLGHRGYFSRGLPMAASSQKQFDDEIMIEEEAMLESKNEVNNIKAIEKKTPKSTAQIPLRNDFRETAFFYPQLTTNSEGKSSFSFEMPDALTQWKFRALAHTESLQTGVIFQSVVTQKELMVMPNTPRFFRAGDQLYFQAMIKNLSEKRQKVRATIRFFDAKSAKPIEIFIGAGNDKILDVLPNDNIIVRWKIEIPEKVQALKYQITAESDNHSDGEEKIIPVLSNRVLVTESLPLTIRGIEEKDFVFENLKEKQSKSLKTASYTIEFAANPAWYVVQALPYIEASNRESSNAVFNRFYANSLAQHIVAKQPKIQSVFEGWKQMGSDELLSNLEKNQELKSILIEETPWLKEAKSESEQKQRIAQLFNINQMAYELNQSLKKLEELQSPNGGWPWFNGMKDNRHITQEIVSGLGHLKKLGVEIKQQNTTDGMLNKALTYLDNRIKEDYDRLRELSSDFSKNNLESQQIQYLYLRSFFTEVPIKEENQEAFQYYLSQAKKFWLDRSLSLQAMQALAIDRLDEKSPLPQQTLASIEDKSIKDEKLGMYWKSNTNGWSWFDNEIETQALLIEAFEELKDESSLVEEMKIWLLRQKQTQAWEGSKATADACYAFLMSGANLIEQEVKVQLAVGKEVFNLSEQASAGTGYFKKNWSGSEFRNDLEHITVKKQNEGLAWGAAYWQYYEDMDKVQQAKVDELSVSKEIFKAELSDAGESIIPIDKSGLTIGDEIVIRLRIESKRNLEFVHLKDQRISGTEPTDVISTYRYQDGLGYYQSTKDASTNFFFDRLNKGVYVFEYRLKASQIGTFSSGLSSLQCQYAPEYTTHSKGRKISIKE